MADLLLDEYDNNVTLEGRKKKKKDKKDKKEIQNIAAAAAAAAAEAAAEAAAAATTTITTSNAATVVDDSKKKKKKEKKDKGEQQIISAAEEEEAIEQVDEVATKKKSKKRNRDLDSAVEYTEEKVELEVQVEEVGGEVQHNKKSKKETKKDGISNVTAARKVELPVTSQRYVAHPRTIAMTTEEISTYRTDKGIQVIPDEDAFAYKPIVSFEYLAPSLSAHCPYLLQYFKDKNFSNPSPIQSECWSPLMSGRDVIGIAATGSGKTLAFLVPALLKLAHMAAEKKAGGGAAGKGRVPQPKVLIIAPTRELAMQSHQVAGEVGGPFQSVCIYGGVPKPAQKRDLSAGAEIVVATPGRLLDLIEEEALSLASICYLVLDEADRMLDDGFEPAIRAILSKCPPSVSASHSEEGRQTVMFSATWPEEIRSLADKFLKKDVLRVCVGGEELSANHRVKQIVECVTAMEKDRKLVKLLEDYHKGRKNRILIFVLYKKEAVDLQGKLQAKGYHVTAIHGDKSQSDRTAALQEFKSGSTPLLIATDVAARGLDIPQVEYVINYSFPLSVEDYVHRIGRTGRGGASGISHTFFTDFDKGLAGALVAVLQEANQEVPKEIYKYPLITKKKQSKLYGDFGPKTELAGKKATKITFD